MMVSISKELGRCMLISIWENIILLWIPSTQPCLLWAQPRQLQLPGLHTIASSIPCSANSGRRSASSVELVWRRCIGRLAGTVAPEKENLVPYLTSTWLYVSACRWGIFRTTPSVIMCLNYSNRICCLEVFLSKAQHSITSCLWHVCLSALHSRLLTMKSLAMSSLIVIWRCHDICKSVTLNHSAATWKGCMRQCFKVWLHLVVKDKMDQMVCCINPPHSYPHLFSYAVVFGKWWVTPGLDSAKQFAVHCDSRCFIVL